jgi:hypothetical protein
VNFSVVSVLLLLQVATDTRLWLFAALTEVRGSLQELITVATNRAEAEADVLMPGQHFRLLFAAAAWISGNSMGAAWSTTAGSSLTCLTCGFSNCVGASNAQYVTPPCETMTANYSTQLTHTLLLFTGVHAGFTHLQQAQTVRWGHWLMSHASAWQRDDMRLRDLLPRVATLPLGSGALAGNPFLVDRQFIARELGMVGGVCPNSMDAVSDRK